MNAWRWFDRMIAAAGIACLASGLVMAVSGAGAAAASTTASGLFAIAATSSTNAWAVGFDEPGSTSLSPPEQTLIERWNGSSWQAVTSPDPGGTDHDNVLTGVSALSAKDAWAVGFYSDGTVNHPLALHWNGSTWCNVFVPFAGCEPGEAMAAVRMASSSDVWAVGTATNCFTLLGVAETWRWNGSKWKLVGPKPPNNPGGSFQSEFTGVAGLPNDVWAVGDYPVDNVEGWHTLTEHQDGQHWKIMPSPNPQGSAQPNFLKAVAAVSAANVWAVGSSVRSFPHSAVTVILHWNGSTWQHVKSPHPGGFNGDELLGVTAIAANDTWAVGDFLDPSTAISRSLAVRWNGSSWQQVPSPSPAGGATLNGVAATSASNAWAVGGDFAANTEHALILRWNGRTWRTQQT